MILQKYDITRYHMIFFQFNNLDCIHNAYYHYKFTQLMYSIRDISKALLLKVRRKNLKCVPQNA